MVTETPKHGVTAVRDTVKRRLPWQLHQWKIVKENGRYVLRMTFWKHTRTRASTHAHTYTIRLADRPKWLQGNLYRLLERIFTRWILSWRPLNSFKTLNVSAIRLNKACTEITCNRTAQVHSAEKYPSRQFQVSPVTHRITSHVITGYIIRTGWY